MICGGDEIGRTQHGNNNSYAQDNEISWYDWNLDELKRALLAFTKRLIALRKAHPNLHRRKFNTRGISPEGAATAKLDGRTEKDVVWFRPSGEEMTEREWQQGGVRCVGLRLSGAMLDDVDEWGEPLRDSTLLLLFNPRHDPVKFVLPAEPVPETCWEYLVDTRSVEPPRKLLITPGRACPLMARSLVLLRAVPPERMENKIAESDSPQESEPEEPVAE
jgi:isoamylase